MDLVGGFAGSVDGTLGSRPGEGAHFSLSYAAARGCYELLHDDFELAPCASIGATWTMAQGFGSTTPTNATAVVADASVGGRMLARLSPHVALRLGEDMVLPFARPSFVIGNEGTVFRPSAAAFRATAGVELFF